MILDFQQDEDALPQLTYLDGRTINSLIVHCQNKAIDPHKVTALHFGPSKIPLPSKIAHATQIAKHFNATVHFSHKDVPITAYPDTRTATLADFERRRAAGERIGNEEEAEED